MDNYAAVELTRTMRDLHATMTQMGKTMENIAERLGGIESALTVRDTDSQGVAEVLDEFMKMFLDGTGVIKAEVEEVEEPPANI
jgi:hypothetical protein